MKNIYFVVGICVVVITGFFLYVNTQSKLQMNPLMEQNVGIANPASEFCLAAGGTHEKIVTSVGESANCLFASGESCEEWAFFRGECVVPGVSTVGANDDSSIATETYKGTDAKGQLLVFAHQEYTKYTLTVGSIVTIGDLNTERGWKDDVDATVYVLNWKGPESEQIVFVRKSGEEGVITQLDTKREEMVPQVILSK